MIHKGTISADFEWLNKPDYKIEDNSLILQTKPDTDFWQRTHYGFSRDNGHCLLTKTSTDFCLSVYTEFAPRAQYDQCGLIVRQDQDNWIKTSTEYETPSHSRLGSVVTNKGFSDWATIDIETPVQHMRYRIQSKNQLADYLIEYSTDSHTWKQLRIAHLHKVATHILIGIYACSPMQGSFSAKFSNFALTQSQWK